MDNDEHVAPESEAAEPQEALTDLEPAGQDADAVTGGAYQAYTSMQGTKQGKFKGEEPPARR